MSQEPLTATERALLESVPEALKSGVELLDWWRKTDAAGSYEMTYKETFVANRPDDTSFGFFGTAPLTSGPIRINGNVQRMFYDEPKAPPEGRDGVSAEWMSEAAADEMNRQVREFILHYFMRISDFSQPQAYPEDHPPPPPGLGIFSQCPEEIPDRMGFGFLQEFYQRAGGGEVGKFDPAEQYRIVDLRDIGEYDWIVLRNPIFNFKFEFKPFGSSGPQLVLPLQQFNYLMLSPDFVIDETNPEPGVLGRYGFGYAFVNKPEPSALAYGPGELQPAFEQIVWEVRDNGEVTVEAIFVAYEPTKMLNLSIDPFVWGFQLLDVVGSQGVQDFLAPFKRLYNRLPTSKLTFDPVFPAIDLLNFFTFQQAGERLCISTDQLRKEFLFIHFLQHYQTIVGSLQTWRQIPDWRNRAALPEFVVTGRSS